MHHHQKQSPVGKTGLSGYETSDSEIVASAEKTGNAVKQLAGLKAQLALRGFAVHDVSTGGYFVAKWNLTKFCPALADLESFAAQVGAA